jgi:hypothetical protein
MEGYRKRAASERVRIGRTGYAVRAECTGSIDIVTAERATSAMDACSVATIEKEMLLREMTCPSPPVFPTFKQLRVACLDAPTRAFENNAHRRTPPSPEGNRR